MKIKIEIEVKDRETAETVLNALAMRVNTWPSDTYVVRDPDGGAEIGRMTVIGALNE